MLLESILKQPAFCCNNFYNYCLMSCCFSYFYILNAFPKLISRRRELYPFFSCKYGIGGQALELCYSHHYRNNHKRWFRAKCFSSALCLDRGKQNLALLLF